jgi:hypothetical protein
MPLGTSSLIITAASLPGNYQDHIVQVLQSVCQPTDEAHIDYSLFDCLSGGNIKFISFCSKGCGGSTTTAGDYCL